MFPTAKEAVSKAADILLTIEIHSMMRTNVTVFSGTFPSHRVNNPFASKKTGSAKTNIRKKEYFEFAQISVRVYEISPRAYDLII